MSYQGFFKPRYPEKYHGDSKRIVYRSRIELVMMTKLDSSPAVTQWTTDKLGVKANLTNNGGLCIPYTDKSQNPPKFRRYFPDFLVKFRSGKVVVIEIKPDKETRPPKEAKTKKQARRYLKEARTYVQNTSKWEAARRYCDKQKWEFRIITEKDLGLY